jgi:hypothetical protein
MEPGWYNDNGILRKIDPFITQTNRRQRRQQGNELIKKLKKANKRKRK